MRIRFVAPALVLVLAGCTNGASPMPSTPGPTATPIVVPVTTAEVAATLVIATDPRFAGAIRLTPELIGASRWWESSPLAGGGYTITLTLGWGDCPAGCIARHVWVFTVTGDGVVTRMGESGDPIPAGGIPK